MKKSKKGEMYVWNSRNINGENYGRISYRSNDNNAQPGHQRNTKYHSDKVLVLALSNTENYDTIVNCNNFGKESFIRVLHGDCPIVVRSQDLS